MSTVLRHKKTKSGLHEVTVACSELKEKCENNNKQSINDAFSKGKNQEARDGKAFNGGLEKVVMNKKSKNTKTDLEETQIIENL